MNNNSEIILGLLIGLIGSFFVIYSLQPQRPYPAIFLNILYQPWILVILFIAVISLFAVEERIAALLLLILIFFIIDVYFLGKKESVV
jgi:hypothetical protein